MKLTIATRKSLLALWQSNYVADRLRALGCECELLLLSTKGDEVLDKALSKIGGKNLFIKELESAMYEGKAQIAVHSLKDVGAELAYDFVLASVCQRECENDVLIFAPHIKANSLAQLPKGAKVGTTSLRRCLQLRALREDLELCNLRGNLQTRLNKLQNGEFDAIVLAYAGIKRLELLGELNYIILDQSEMISAAGQGAVAIEAVNEPEILALLKQLECAKTRALVDIERDFTNTLNGGCGAPIGINASVENNKLTIRAIVGNPSLNKFIKMQESYELDANQSLSAYKGAGINLAQRFISAGAQELINEGN